jgi:hypothetical protein
MASIKIDGKEYDIDSLPQEVKSQFAALQQCDQKINSWNMNIALAQTARGAYAAELNLLLEQVTEVGAEEVEVLEAEEVDEVEVLEAEEVEVSEAEEVDKVEVLEAEEIEPNR